MKISFKYLDTDWMPEIDGGTIEIDLSFPSSKYIKEKIIETINKVIKERNWISYEITD